VYTKHRPRVKEMITNVAIFLFYRKPMYEKLSTTNIFYRQFNSYTKNPISSGVFSLKCQVNFDKKSSHVIISENSILKYKWILRSLKHA
jgi:hypothetical protein